MSAYLKFFELEQSPFEGKAQSQVVLGTKALRDAFALIRSGLDEGTARICVNGGPGLGKTSLARALPKLLDESTRVAVILDAHVSWESVRGSIAKQWGLATGGLARSGLLEAARNRRLVLVIDQAERASEEFLDHLDVVLSYRSESDEPVVQSVLMASLSATDPQEPAPIVWWLDRIQTLQLEFAPLSRDGIESYIHKHLKRAGWRGERLFRPEAALAIHEYSGGIPGEVSRLCERLLAEAAESGLRHIDATFVHALCDEGEAEVDSALDPENEPAIEDEFEDLVLAEEFNDATAAAGPPLPTIDFVEAVVEAERPPTLAETLEHFEGNEAPIADADADADVEESIDELEEDELESDEYDEESLASLESYLSAPPSQEELRSIQGHIFNRHGRSFAAAAIAALLGGLALASLSGDTESYESNAGGDSERVAQAMLGSAERPSADAGPAGMETAPPTPLARLRGPVAAPDIAPESLGTAPAPSQPMNAHGRDHQASNDQPPEVEIEDPDFEGVIPEGDLIDMRPAAMLPDATRESDAPEDRFW
jgi:type II secretory pathway predicted ATPase ExeA